MKILLLSAISVDGRIGLNADHFSNWTSKEDKKFFSEKTKESGVIIMGRKTFDTIGRPLPGRINIVMTRDTSNTENQLGLLEYTSDSPREIIKNLQDRGFDSVVIGGGASIYSLFLQEDLVTDLYLTIEPVLFGKGVSVVDGIDQRKLNLESLEQLNNQTILLHYTLNPRIEYPYMPVGRHLKYVSIDNPHMQSAIRAQKELSGDLMWPIGAVLVKNDQAVAAGGNGFSIPSKEPHICERYIQDCKSGEGYDLCSFHDSLGHAEQMTIKRAREAGIDPFGGDIYMFGHWWCCKSCWDAMIDAGIRDVYVCDDAHERFTKEKVYNVTLKPSISSVYVAGSITHLNESGMEADYKDFYKRIGEVIERLGVKAVVPHLADSENIREQRERDAEKIYRWSVGQVSDNDVVIAEVSMPSLGVGGELEAAVRSNTPIILISKKGKIVSKFATGNPMVKYHLEYDDFNDAIVKIERIIKML